jgi:transposase InsO family protein
MSEVRRNRRYQPVLGHAHVHTVIDDHSRVAYAEIHDDDTAKTATAVLQRAVGWFRARGITVERVLSDNGACYKSYAWRDACAELHIRHTRTRPYRPQTNGKIERFHRTMAGEWAFARHYPNERTRRTPLAAWLHTYNHCAPSTLSDRQSPAHHPVDQPAWAVHLGRPGSTDDLHGHGYY